MPAKSDIGEINCECSNAMRIASGRNRTRRLTVLVDAWVHFVRFEYIVSIAIDRKLEVVAIGISPPYDTAAISLLPPLVLRQSESNDGDGK